MNQKLRKIIGRRRWQILLGIIAILLVTRALLPFAIKYYVNKTLDGIPEYAGRVENIDLNLWRGAYEIEDMELVKINGNNEIPFFSARQMDLSVEWSALFDGSIVGEIKFYQPNLNYVAAPSEEESQTEIDRSWQDAVQDLLPIKINSFEIIDGKIRFLNFHSEPQVDVSLDSLQLTAVNLTNSKDLSDEMAGTIDARAILLEQGRFKGHLELDPFTDKPTFDLDAELTAVNLVRLNEFIKAYEKFDVEQGTMGIYAELAAASGRFDGYVKPIFEKLDVINLAEDSGNPLQVFWESVVGAMGEILQNQPKDRLATKIPFSGRFEDPETDLFAIIGSLLRNAFIRALLPSLEGSVNLEEVKAKDG